MGSKDINLKATRVYSVAETEFVDAVSSSSSIKEALARIQCTPYTRYYDALRLRCEELNIPFPFYAKNNFLKKAVPLNEVLIENSSYNRQNLKRRLIEEGLLIEECAIIDCPTRALEGIWIDKPVPWQIDHINGVNNDNRLENLRLLCPICHALTDTYCGKQNKGRVLNPDKDLSLRGKDPCPGCDGFKSKRAKFCINCTNTTSKIDWPCEDELWERIGFSNFRQVGKDLGVSDNAIRKHLGIYGVFV